MMVSVLSNKSCAARLIARLSGASRAPRIAARQRHIALRGRGEEARFARTIPPSGQVRIGPRLRAPTLSLVSSGMALAAQRVGPYLCGECFDQQAPNTEPGTDRV